MPRKEDEELKLLLNGFDEEMETSSNMDIKFYSMLNAEEQKKNKVSLFEKIRNVLQAKFTKQLIYTFAILTVGFFVGNTFNFNKTTTSQTLDLTQNETENIRSKLVLILLNQSSKNKKLQAANEMNKLSSVIENVTKALFSTLNNDINVITYVYLQLKH